MYETNRKDIVPIPNNGKSQKIPGTKRNLNYPQKNIAWIKIHVIYLLCLWID